MYCTYSMPISQWGCGYITGSHNAMLSISSDFFFLLVCSLLLFFPICESKEPVQKAYEHCNECNTWAKSAWCWQSDYLAISTPFLILRFPALCSSVCTWDTISDEMWSAGGGGCSSYHDTKTVLWAVNLPFGALRVLFSFSFIHWGLCETK